MIIQKTIVRHSAPSIEQNGFNCVTFIFKLKKSLNYFTTVYTKVYFIMDKYTVF